MKANELAQGVRRLSEHATAPFEEIPTRDALHRWLEELKLTFEVDAYGNTLVRVRRGMPRRTVAFVAHLDHPGLRVESVSPAGVVCVGEGGQPLKSLKGAKVVFPRCKAGAASGVVTVVKTKEEDGRVKLDRATIKLGAKSAQPEPGDFAVLDLPAFAKTATRIKARVCDDLAGCVAVIATLATLAKGSAPVDVIGVFTRAEEVGFVGALGLAIEYRLPRDSYVVSIECSAALGDIELGKGPVVRLGDRHGPFDPRCSANILGAAKQLAEKKFDYQVGIMPGGTCEATPFLTFGYAAAGIAVPLANYHNQGPKGVACEEIDLRDLEGAVKLACTTALRIGTGTEDMDLYRNQLVMSSQEKREKLRAPMNHQTGYPSGTRF
jgi:putative aminopeptidase FrvX